MKKFTAVTVVLVSLALSSCATVGSGSGPIDDLEGAWELVTSPEDPLRYLKLLAEDHFTWVIYHRATGEVVASAGGVWSRDAGGYRERVDFATSGMASGLIGLEQRFSLELRDGVWSHVGKLTNGENVDQRWRRVPGPGKPTPVQ